MFLFFNSVVCHFSVSLSSLTQSLIEAHDKVASKCYEMPIAAVNYDAPVMNSLMPADTVRMIGIQKRAGEPLVSHPGTGITHISAEGTQSDPSRL